MFSEYVDGMDHVRPSGEWVSKVSKKLIALGLT